MAALYDLPPTFDVRRTVAEAHGIKWYRHYAPRPKRGREASPASDQPPRRPKPSSVTLKRSRKPRLFSSSSSSDGDGGGGGGGDQAPRLQGGEPAGVGIEGWRQGRGWVDAAADFAAGLPAAAAQRLSGARRTVQASNLAAGLPRFGAELRRQVGDALFGADARRDDDGGGHVWSNRAAGGGGGIVRSLRPAGLGH